MSSQKISAEDIESIGQPTSYDQNAKHSTSKDGNSTESLLPSFFANKNEGDHEQTRIKFMQTLRNSIIGFHEAVFGPFGERKIVYCDETASNKSVTFIEDFIQKEVNQYSNILESNHDQKKCIHFQVLPFYGNTHTTTSYTGKQTTMLREEARSLIKRVTNCHYSKGSDKDVVIFTGNGSTSVNPIVSLIQKKNLNQ